MSFKPRARFILVGSLLSLIVFAGLLNTLATADGPGHRPWSFGVMSDTQWTCATDPAGQNLNHVAVSIINQINQQFIDKRVKFVIQVGDLTENGNDADITMRANAAQALYAAGIGFFPMRGNHETYANPANDYGIHAFKSNFPQTQLLANRFGASDASSPTNSYWLKGMSYSFDYNNARFVILDDWATPDKRVDAAGYPYGYSIADQQAWISARLRKSTRPDHAFVFSHQNLMGENHQDSLFTGYTNANPDMQNAFFASLQNNGVRYYISGHDHIHQRSLIKSPDGLSRVQELICASDSSKFYTPKALTDPNWFGQKIRETSVSQEKYAVGFYIYTVDGPRVTVDYYSDDHGQWLSDNNYPGSNLPNQVTPAFNFVKKETWGYGLNGREFLIAQGDSYQAVEDRHDKTRARILGGSNTSTEIDYTGRSFTQTVNTGWAEKGGDDLRSDILSLTGMAKKIGDFETPQYALSLTYEEGKTMGLGNGSFGLATLDDDRKWVRAVDMNNGGTTNFVVGPWKASYPLGTYGVDPHTKTAWAVINFNGDFAVSSDLGRLPHKEQK